MKPLSQSWLLPVLLALVVFSASLPAAAEKEKKVVVPTTFSLLVGFPSAAEGEAPGTLFAPGTVIPLRGDRPAPGASTEKDSDALFELAANLRRTVRLESLDAKYRITRALVLDQEELLPRPASASPLFISATLIGATDELASYRVRFRDGGELLADTRVAVERGGRAVVGGLDGEAAPYLFLVLEPAAAGSARDLTPVGEDFTPPRIIQKSPPTYTAEAKEQRIQGVVIVQAVIDTDGTVQDVIVLKGLPSGLTEAAVEAVKNWTFEPALDADGQPVRVYYNLTLNFVLE